MLSLDTDQKSALLDDTSVIGFFISLGLVQSGVVTWYNFSNQVMPVTLDTQSYSGDASLIDFVLPQRRTLNLDGGRDWTFIVVDATHDLFDRFSQSEVDKTRVDLYMSMFFQNRWTSRLQLQKGFISGLEWISRDRTTKFTCISRLAKDRGRPAFVTSFDQLERDSNDNSLSQAGRQVFLNWED